MTVTSLTQLECKPDQIITIVAIYPVIIILEKSILMVGQRKPMVLRVTVPATREADDYPILPCYRWV